GQICEAVIGHCQRVSAPMKNKYLTSTLKSKYLLDFDKLLQETDGFWGIENEFLKEKLIRINRSSNIQTLYSKYGNKHPSDWISYLQFAYTKKVEPTLFKVVIPGLLYNFNQNGSDESVCYYEFHKPSVRPKQTKSRFDLACIDDKNYFNINSIKIFL